MSRRKIGKAILRSNLFQSFAARIFYSALWFIYKTNRIDKEDMAEQHKIAYQHSPAIFVFWHGQHLLTSFVAAPGQKLVALVSKSADAEINARILKLAGHDVVRGSGGRVREAAHEKGGVSATLALKDALKSGQNIGIIADVSKTAPRKSGKGVVRLAKMSGRPIIPIAVATSNFKVIEKSWDKTTINLPFGQCCVRIGNPIYVSKDSTREGLEEKRSELDIELNRITSEAYKVVGSHS